MSNYEHGRILAVNETRLGSELVSAHAVGVLSLTVEDPVDFDEDGGCLKIADQVIEYTTFDDDTGEITLAEPLAAAAEDGDRVWLWDPLRQVITTDKVAQVELDGDDDNTDPIEATIAHHLVDDLDEGIRGGTGESVLLELDGDEWRIVDVLGLSSQGAMGRASKQDVFVLAADGPADLTLTHVPIPESENVSVGGVYQWPGVDWTRDGQTLSLLRGAPHNLAGDVVVCQYDYLTGVATPPSLESGTVPGQPSTTITDTATATVQMPRQVQQGDLLVAARWWGTGRTVMTPAGWTDTGARLPSGRSTTVDAGVWIKVADANDVALSEQMPNPGEVGFGLSNFGMHGVVLTHIRGWTAQPDVTVDYVLGASLAAPATTAFSGTMLSIGLAVLELGAGTGTPSANGGTDAGSGFDYMDGGGVDQSFRIVSDDVVGAVPPQRNFTTPDAAAHDLYTFGIAVPT